MSPDSQGNYYQSSLGSISGFNQTNLPSDSFNLTRVGWSIDQLQQFLLNISDVNFPTDDWVRKVDELITSHITDYNNPHHVTLDQIISDFTRDVLNNIVAGTPPNIPPFFAYDAICPLPLNEVYPAAYSYSNLYTMNEGGVLQNRTQDSELLGTDQVTGVAGLPLFLSFTNSVPANWATRPSTPLNTTITLRPSTNLFYPFGFYAVSENTGNGPFGINLPFTSNLNQVYTVSFFLLPTIVGGSIVINQQGNIADTATIDLLNHTVTTSSDAIMAQIYSYASGVIRVTASFTASVNSTTNNVIITHLNPEATTTSRSGQANRQIFSIGNPTVAPTSINHPIILNAAAPALTSDLTLSLAAVSAPASFNELMITLTFDLYPTLDSDTTIFGKLLSFGSLSIQRDQTHLYVYKGSNKIFTSKILEGLNIVSLSYSSTKIIFKDLASPRQTVTGSFSPLATNSVYLGKCNGYLRSLAFYAAQDNNQCVEFLTNG